MEVLLPTKTAGDHVFHQEGLVHLEVHLGIVQEEGQALMHHYYVEGRLQPLVIASILINLAFVVAKYIKVQML